MVRVIGNESFCGSLYRVANLLFVSNVLYIYVFFQVFFIGKIEVHAPWVVGELETLNSRIS